MDAHHTVEDVAIALGREIDGVLQDRSGLSRFGWAYAPLDRSPQPGRGGPRQAPALLFPAPIPCLKCSASFPAKWCPISSAP